MRVRWVWPLLLAAVLAPVSAGIYGPAGGGLTQAQADLLYAPIGAGGVTMSQVYPIGSIYVSTVPTNPGTLLGVGTWVAFGTGRVLTGIDAGQSEFDTVEETGGVKTVAAEGSVSAPTITVNALVGGTRKGGTSNPGSIIENGNVPTASASVPTFTGSATSVVQPYIVVYMWKRTL